MIIRPFLRRCALLLLLVGLPLTGCGDDGTGPDAQTPTFPQLDAAVIGEFCIRGTVVPGGTVSGDLSVDADCPTVSPVGSGPGRFFEAWRLRVGAAGSYTLGTTGSVDTFVDVFTIPDPDVPVLSGNLVDFDDDDGPDANALLTVSLEPDTEYWVMVSGYDAADEGPYTLVVEN